MFIATFISVALIIFVFVTVLFFVSILVRRNDIADIAWGIGILIVAGSSYFLQSEQNILAGLMVLFIALWGLRLSIRILLRNIKKEEDYRYKQWRDAWGKWFYPRSYLQVYLLQGALMIVVGYGAVHASVYGAGSSFGALTIVGIFVWALGYFFETVGDWQLDRFIASKPAPGTILATGLWKYTRHPNYFGEVTMWWGLWLMIAHLPMGYLALISPLTITFLILKVSGIPMLEKRFEGNPAFEEYKRKTNAFFPWRPRV